MSVLTDRAHERALNSESVRSLAEVSDAPRVREASQAAAQCVGSTIPNVSGGLANTGPPRMPGRDCLLHSDAPIALLPVARRRGLTIVGLVGFILGVASTAALTNLGLQDWSEWAVGEPFKLASSLASRIGIQRYYATPHLIARPSHGLSGEPLPLALEVHGPAEGATIFILGLLPGMDLSAGEAFGENSWQLGATDVANGWIAPPKNFVGSAELVAELRLPNNKIADRQVLHLEWLPSDPAPALVQQNATEPPNSPAVRTTQAEIAQAPLNPREPAQPQFDKQANTSAGVDRRLSGLSEGLASADVVPKGHISPPKGNSKQAGRTAGRRRLAPQPDLRDGKNESRPAIAPGTGARIGFWDWSR